MLSALMTLRGLEFLTAATVLAELGDLRRFPHPKQLMSFRYRRMQARGLHQNKTCIAIAREISAFIWDIARRVPIAAA